MATPRDWELVGRALEDARERVRPKMSRQKLADLVKTNPQQIQKLEKAVLDPTRISWLKRILPHIGIKQSPAAFLESVLNPNQSAPHSDILSELIHRNVTWGTGETVPVMGAVEGATERDYGTLEWSGEVVGRVLAIPSVAGAKDAYALRCSGDSMEPRYRAGETVFIDPHKPLSKGCFVVVQFKREQHGPILAWVKEYVRQTNDAWVFRQLNPDKELKLDRRLVLKVHRIVGSTEPA